jgi:alkanesulfonate monooxygenase SsuD/methylene tetrahydromethanopterin reductase-like flavin-dependent oxidoreductase (luciferase family)
MRFDLFFEVSKPPFQQMSESQAFDAVLAQAETADKLGFGGMWLVEHHFMRHYSHSAKPELILAALARSTQRIRLGLGVVPLPYHHPVHVAERIATLDILSKGRLDVGVGRGFSPAEYAAFGIDMALSRSLTRESLDILRLSFARKPVSYHGRHFRLERVDILPHVLQEPHPPLWTAAVSPESFAWAAEQGLNVLVGPFKPWFMVQQDIQHFRRLWKRKEEPQIGMTVGVLCLEDGKRARQLAKPAFAWFYRQLLATTLPVLEQAYPSYEHFHELGRFRHLLKLGVNLRLLETFGMALVGSPEECLRRIQEFRAVGVTHLLCAVGAGALAPEITLESLHCLARKVLPACQ